MRKILKSLYCAVNNIKFKLFNKMKIGKNVIHRKTKVKSQGGITIGNNCFFQDNNYIENKYDGGGVITIGNNVYFSRNCTLKSRRGGG